MNRSALNSLTDNFILLGGVIVGFSAFGGEFHNPVQWKTLRVVQKCAWRKDGAECIRSFECAQRTHICARRRAYVISAAAHARCFRRRRVVIIVVQEEGGVCLGTRARAQHFPVLSSWHCVRAKSEPVTRRTGEPMHVHVSRLSVG